MTSLNITKYLSPLFVILMLNNCAQESESKESRVSYGFVQDYKTLLIHKRNGADIKVCGNISDEIFNGIKESIAVWGNAISRTYTVSKSRCNVSDITAYPYGSYYAESGCKSLSERGINAAMYVEFENMRLVSCTPADSTYITHEVGHLFGLCDQYAGAPANCVSSTTKDPKSIMAGGYFFGILQEDDIAGIRALAKKYSYEQ